MEEVEEVEEVEVVVNIISSDYCCDPDIYPWGYHQLTHCTAVNIA